MEEFSIDGSDGWNGIFIHEVACQYVSASIKFQNKDKASAAGQYKQ
jgi:hypothetical protein